MKCDECSTQCVENTCFPDNPNRPGWVVHYCPNKPECHLASLHVPQVPGRKPVNTLDNNLAKA